MSNALVPVGDLERMAQAFAKSNLFGAKTPDQCLALLLLAQGEGMHPAIAMRDFDVIQGRPAKKSEAMLRSFLAAGGSVEWHEMSDTKADASFTHPQGSNGKPVRISWDLDRAKKAGLANKDNWTKYGRAMLANRVISEGCRRVYPAATSGLYEPGEVRDIVKQEKRTEKDMGKATVVEEDHDISLEIPGAGSAAPQASPPASGAPSGASPAEAADQFLTADQVTALGDALTENKRSKDALLKSVSKQYGKQVASLAFIKREDYDDAMAYARGA